MEPMGPNIQGIPTVQEMGRPGAPESISPGDGFPTGVTLCAADPDLIVVTVASRGINDRTGFQAADGVVKAIIEGRG